MSSKPADCIDQQDILERLGGGGELLKEVVDIFLHECPARLQRLREAIRLRDRGDLAFAAHSFAGCLSMFAARHAAELCAQLEQLARSGDLDDGTAVFEALCDEVAPVKVALQELAEQQVATRM